MVLDGQIEILQHTKQKLMTYNNIQHVGRVHTSIELSMKVLLCLVDRGMILCLSAFA